MGGGAAERLRAAGRRDSHKAARAALAVLAEGGVDEAVRWEATEQLCVAQLDCGQHEEAARTLARVVGRFPSAQHTRTRRLQAAAAEARGDAETVCVWLAGRARDDGGAATDVVAMKRQAALLREAGDLAGAVEQTWTDGTRRSAWSRCCWQCRGTRACGCVLQRRGTARASRCLRASCLRTRWSCRAGPTSASWRGASTRALLGLCVACRAVVAAGSKFAATAGHALCRRDVPAQLIWPLQQTTSTPPFMHTCIPFIKQSRGCSGAPLTPCG